MPHLGLTVSRPLDAPRSASVGVAPSISPGDGSAASSRVRFEQAGSGARILIRPLANGVVAVDEAAIVSLDPGDILGIVLERAIPEPLTGALVVEGGTGGASHLDLAAAGARTVVASHDGGVRLGIRLKAPAQDAPATLGIRFSWAAGPAPT